MRNISILVAAVFISATATAQQVWWGEQNIVSPEIHPDNTVTFRFYAPKAMMVQVTGDFLPAQKTDTPFGQYDAPGVAGLQKGKDGLWEFTTPAPLASELYGYAFIVDGLRMTDPNNVFLIRDVTTVINVFLVGGGQGDYYRVSNVPHGTVARRWYNSPGLKAERRMTIYTPPGYESGKESYPVFYLLHGGGGDEEAWIQQGRASQVLDNLIAQGKAKPMIVVMPNGHMSTPAAAGESSKGFQKPEVQITDITAGEMELSFIDIIRFVESNYRVKKDKANRAIAGLSMGGLHSLHISAFYPNTFGYIGLFSNATLDLMKSFPGATVLTGDKEPIVYRDFDKKLETQMKNGYKLYWIACGKTDFVLPGVNALRAKMDRMGMKYVYRESEGGHTWANWRLYLTEFAQLLFK